MGSPPGPWVRVGMPAPHRTAAGPRPGGGRGAAGWTVAVAAVAVAVAV